MMKKIIAFAGSTSQASINKQLATYTASLVDDIKVDIIDMNDYTSKLFSVDEEKNGFPEKIQILSKLFSNYDGFIVSLAEHNGSYASAYKNTIDWLSRLERKVFYDKPMLLLSTSPGGRGGASVSKAAQDYYPRLGAQIAAVFSLPNFYDNFSEGKIINKEFDALLKEKVKVYLNKI